MSDFIREVDEDYRRDRIVQFLRRYQLLLIGVAVLVVVGTAGYRFYTDRQTKAAEAANTRYEAAAQLVREGKLAEAQKAFDALQKEGPGGYAALARISAVEALAAHDPAAAARGFDAIVQDGGMDASLRDVAQMRSALIRIDEDDPQAFEKRYGPVATPTFPFRASLRELLAMAALKRNDTEAAGRWLDQVVIDDQTPNGLRKRAEAFLGLVAAGPVRTGEPEAPPQAVAPVPATPQAAPAAAPATPPQTPSATTNAAPEQASPSAVSPAAPPPTAPPAR
jgi:hypothetical protein